MKIVILITVIESLAVTLAIMYFYYRRSQSGKRALVLRRGHVSIESRLRSYCRLATTRNGRSLINRVTAMTSNPRGWRCCSFFNFETENEMALHCRSESKR